MDFSGLGDTKETSIRHALPVTFKTSGRVRYNASGTFEYTAQDEDRLKKVFNSANTMAVNGKTISGGIDDVASYIDFDPSVWAQWDEPKWLEITYPK